MPITSETFYRAECDHLECTSTIPNGDDDDASHWVLSAVEEYLREPHETGMADVELSWFYDGEQTLCPRHAPGATPCGTCDGQGAVRVEGAPANNPDWSFAFHWDACPECHWVGFHPAPQVGEAGAWKWTCQECGATGPMPEDVLASPHDCKSRGPFDNVARLLVERTVQADGSER